MSHPTLVDVKVPRGLKVLAARNASRGTVRRWIVTLMDDCYVRAALRDDGSLGYALGATAYTAPGFVRDPVALATFEAERDMTEVTR